MTEDLNRAVEKLLLDRGFVRRFRRDPKAALAKFDLTAEERAAIKSGRTDDLLRLGLDPAYAWPTLPSPLALQSWLLRNVRRLAPAAFLAAAFLASPASAGATPPTTGLSRAARRAARSRRGLPRALARELARRGTDTGRKGGLPPP